MDYFSDVARRLLDFYKAVVQPVCDDSFFLVHRDTKKAKFLRTRRSPKEPPFKGSFHLFFVQLLSLLSFSLLYLKQFYILIPISTIPENNYLFTNTLKTKPYQNSNTFE